MSFLAKVWRLLVGIKDALVLATMLLFFALLYSLLSSTPNAAAIEDGAYMLSWTAQLPNSRSGQAHKTSCLIRHPPCANIVCVMWFMSLKLLRPIHGSKPSP